MESDFQLKIQFVPIQHNINKVHYYTSFKIIEIKKIH